MRVNLSRLGKVSVVLPVFAALLLQPSTALPCTTFLMSQDGIVMGKSLDWDISAGHVVINKKGVFKRALTLSSQDTGAEWTSEFASITFNQYGVEFPHAGMNEAGLVVENAWLTETRYPARDARPMVNEGQWVQWALDSFETVAELAAAAPGVRVYPAFADLHYFACDLTGACATFEYLGGNLVITSGSGMTVNTLANDTYADSVAYLSQFEGFGGSAPIPGGTGSLQRFVRASSLAVAEQTKQAPDSAFAILDSVAQGSFSVWNVVYLVDERRVYFRTYASSAIKSVDLAAFEPGCWEGRKVLDIDTEEAGDAAGRFEPYSLNVNRALIDKSESYLPPGAADMAAAYPDTTTCTLERPEDPDPDPDPDGDGGGCSTAGAGDSSAVPGGALLALFLAFFATRRRRH